MAHHVFPTADGEPGGSRPAPGVGQIVTTLHANPQGPRPGLVSWAVNETAQACDRANQIIRLSTRSTCSNRRCSMRRSNPDPPSCSGFALREHAAEDRLDRSAAPRRKRRRCRIPCRRRTWSPSKPLRSAWPTESLRSIESFPSRRSESACVSCSFLIWKILLNSSLDCRAAGILTLSLWLSTSASFLARFVNQRSPNGQSANSPDKSATCNTSTSVRKT